MSENLRALSIRQPWAELILQGRKKVEIRSWEGSYRGPLWLHVSGKFDPSELARFGLEDLFVGGYAGVVTVASIVPLDEARWGAWQSLHLSGPFQPGQFGWLLDAPRRFRRPIPGPGRLGLFQPSAETERSLRRAQSAAELGQDHGS